MTHKSELPFVATIKAPSVPPPVTSLRRPAQYPPTNGFCAESPANEYWSAQQSGQSNTDVTRIRRKGEQRGRTLEKSGGCASIRCAFRTIIMSRILVNKFRAGKRKLLRTLSVQYASKQNFEEIDCRLTRIVLRRSGSDHWLKALRCSGISAGQLKVQRRARGKVYVEGANSRNTHSDSSVKFV